MTVLVELPVSMDPSLPLPLAMLVAALDAMAAQAPADIVPAQALLETQVLLVQQDRLKALTLSRVADVDTRGLHDLDGSPSTGMWIAEQQTSMPRSEIALARKLERAPLVAARIAAGGLSVAGGVKICKALTALRPHLDRPDGLIDGQPSAQVLLAVILDGVSQLVGEAAGGLADDDPRLSRLLDDLAEIVDRPTSELARLEAAFLVLARHVEPGQLQGGLGCLVDALLPQQLAERAAAAERDSRLSLTRDDDRGGWDLRASLDLEAGELLHTALTAAMATDPDNTMDTAQAAQARALGLDPYEQDSCLRLRSFARRRHDALKLVLRALLDTGALGQRGKHAPQINVTISEPALNQLPGALPARAASGAPWPAALVRRILCDSAVTRFVLSLGHRVVESSHTERTLKPHERRIKNIETGGICQAAGCNRGHGTGHRLIPHHATPYAICGTTSLGDTVLFCEVTHHDLHEGGKTIRLTDGRLLSPTGWIDSGAAA